MSRSAGSCPALVAAAYARLLVRAVRCSKPASPGPPPHVRRRRRVSLAFATPVAATSSNETSGSPHVLLSPVRACCAPVSSTKSSAHGTARHHPPGTGRGRAARRGQRQPRARVRAFLISLCFSFRTALRGLASRRCCRRAELFTRAYGGVAACMHACRSSSIIGG